MIVGLFLWFLIFNPKLTYSTTIFLLLGVLGSSFVGLTTFSYSLGSNFYFTHHVKHLPRLWQSNGILRTLIQFYFWGSVLLLFLIAEFLAPRLNLDYFIMLILISIPAYSGSFLARRKKIRNILEEFAEKKFQKYSDPIQ